MAKRRHAGIALQPEDEECRHLLKQIQSMYGGEMSMLADFSLVPCVIFAFNRPDKLERVLSALKTQDIKHLIVFVDGPRDDADVELVARCRTIAKGVDWVDKELHFREQNRGLPGLSHNISTVMNVYKSAVVVEDDCLPMPGFYSFMRRALNHYESEKKVFSIGGYQPISQKYFKNYPYSLVSSARFLCWGWATWQDRWELVTPYLSRCWELFDGLTNVPDVAGHDLATMARACAEGRLETWAVQVAISTLWLGKVHLLPTKGLVRNIGHDSSGVHGGSSRRSKQGIHNRNVYEHSLENTVWLENVEINRDYDKKLKQFVKRASSIFVMKKIENRLRQWPLLITLWRLLRRTKAKLFKPRPKRLYDFVLQQDEALTQRALFSYIVRPFFIARDDPKFLRHINIWRAQEIVRILNGLGYKVDIIDYRDSRFVPRRTYDLFIGHGGINFEKIATRLTDKTTKIYFSTGNYWKFHNEQELARFAALRYRRGIDLPLDRFINDSEERALLAADGIIGVGNDFTRRTYAGFSPAIMINNTTLIDNHYEKVQKDFEAGRSHLLYYAGEGNVHKGLDLLIEAFLQLENYHLWICTSIEQQFKQVYSEALWDRSNIHVVGWIEPRTSIYYEMMERCNWAILPSCSEGGAQSVVECVNQGLIPVVSQACGLDVGDYGVILDSCTIEEIARVVPMLSSYPATRCREMSLRARKAAISGFSETAFYQSMKEAIQYILELKRKGNTECSKIHF